MVTVYLLVISIFVLSLFVSGLFWSLHVCVEMHISLSSRHTSYMEGSKHGALHYEQSAVRQEPMSSRKLVAC
jgi:hypothetical protein